MPKERENAVSPQGESFPIPLKDEYNSEFQRLEKLAQEAKASGKEIVVVMGLGFVGVVMAAVPPEHVIVAQSVHNDAKPV